MDWNTFHLRVLSCLCCWINKLFKVIKPWDIIPVCFQIEIDVGGKILIGCPIGWEIPNEKDPRFTFVARTAQTAETLSPSYVPVSLIILKL